MYISTNKEPKFLRTRSLHLIHWLYRSLKSLFQIFRLPISMSDLRLYIDWLICGDFVVKDIFVKYILWSEICEKCCCCQVVMIQINEERTSFPRNLKNLRNIQPECMATLSSFKKMMFLDYFVICSLCLYLAIYSTYLNILLSLQLILLSF